MSKNGVLKLFLSLIFCNIMLATCGCGKDERGFIDTSHHLLIAGYLANYRMANYNLDNLKYVDRLYYFSVCPNERGELEISQEDISNIKLIKSRLGQSQSLYLVVGGWTQSKNIPQMASVKSLREEFVRNVAEFCKENGLQGVDLDWEDFPAEVNKEDFSKLVEDLSKALHSERLGFTIALGVSDKKIQMAVNSLPYVDEINIMSYGKFDEAGNQAPMELFQSWLLNYLTATVPKEKLIVGVPFYGKRLANSSDTSRVAVSFAEIVTTTHPASSVNWFKNYSYNGLQLIKEKTN
ncbi:MAG TPA: glycoside hydrolase family 18 protein, partial [Chitinophagaceae bacterium]